MGLPAAAPHFHKLFRSEKKHRPINHRHRKVKNEQVVCLFKRKLKAVFRIRRGIDLATQTTGQGFPHDPEQPDIIIHHQNLLGRVLRHNAARLRESVGCFKL